MTPTARRKGRQLFSSDMKLRLEISAKTMATAPAHWPALDYQSDDSLLALMHNHNDMRVTGAADLSDWSPKRSVTKETLWSALLKRKSMPGKLLDSSQLTGMRWQRSSGMWTGIKIAYRVWNDDRR